MPFGGHKTGGGEMKGVFRIVLVLALVLTGCLQTETKIKVEKDGSGTVEQKVILRKDIIELMKGVQASMGQVSEEYSILNEEKLKEDAIGMGKGVQFVEAKPLQSPIGEGYWVRYAFTDINSLQVSETPLMGDTPPFQAPGTPPQGQFFKFQFTRGTPATLMVYISREELNEKEPESKEAEEWEEEWELEEEAEQEQDIEMMKEFLQDMKLAIRIEVGGTITSSNADFRSGSTVTLMDVDFNKIVQNQKAFDVLTSNKVNSLAELKEFSRKYPGLQMETKDKVRIQFR
jgi:hypothetical protein